MDRIRSLSPPLSPGMPGVSWVPDEEAVACFLCHADFSQVRRKHHCRACGRVVCNECSQKRARLPKYADKQRVCDECEHRTREDATLAIADEIRVEKDMSNRLKQDLMMKSQQIDKFKTFLLSLESSFSVSSSSHTGDVKYDSGDFDGLLQAGEVGIKSLSKEAEEERERRKRLQEEFSELKKKYDARQQDAQKLAARVLRAESNLNDKSQDDAERDVLEREVQDQNRIIEGLRERLRATTESASLPPTPLSPHGVTEEVIASGRIEEPRRQICNRRCGRRRDECTIM